MANWTYEITVSAGHYMKNGSTVTGTIKRTSPASVSDVGLYALTGACTVTSNAAIQTYVPDVYLTFGSYFWIGALENKSSTHAITETGHNLSSSILSVGTSGQSIDVVCKHEGGSGNGCYIKYAMTFTVTVGVTNKYSASTISCVSPVNFGSASSVSFSNSKLSSLYHKVTWTINSSYTYTLTTATGASSASYAIPSGWMASCPTATSVNCTVTVATMYGSSTIGSASKTIVLNVPSDVKPSIGSLTASIYNDTSKGSFATNNGVFIQNLCGITITANNATGGTGATVSSYAFTSSADDEGEASGNAYTVAVLLRGGAITYTVTVTDSRGRQASASRTVNVISYSQPVITAYDAYRCVENGTGSETGTYAQIRCAATVSPVQIGGVAYNTMTIKSYYYLYTTGTPVLTTAIADMTSGASYVVGGGNLDASSTYYARFVVEDAMGGRAQVDTIVSSASYAIHVKNGGTGVAFGKTSEISNSVEINPGWNFYYKGFMMAPVVYSESSAPSNPVVGLVWLKKK